ncbi:MAG: hypothetical protein Kow00103_09190 [Candidatus Caldatribacteriota bacterium]
MKKALFLMALLLTLGLILVGCTSLTNITTPSNPQEGFTYLTKGGPTENEAESFPLYAGQDWLVGEVLVWDDGNQVCVKYVLDPAIQSEGWGFTETHLAIATDPGNIPQTKPLKGQIYGNPIPGKFPYGDDDLGRVGEAGPYCIFLEDFGVECGDTLVIAAHAVIEKEDCKTIQGTITPDLVWERSSEDSVVAVSGEGASWEPAVQLGMDTPLSGDAVWDGGKIGQYFTGYSSRSDLEWASWSHKNTGSSDLRLFKATFNLAPEIADNITSAVLRMPGFTPDVIPINDNLYIFLNEELQFWGGTRVAGAAGSLTSFQGMNGIPATATYLEPDWGGLDFTGWYIPGTFPDLSIAGFISGDNILHVFTEENDTGGGMAKLELVLEYEYEECATYSESAWAAVDEPGNIRFVSKGNWATYFEYNIECPLICIDFSLLDIAEGESIEGEDKVYNGLTIEAIGGNAVKLLPDAGSSDPATYGAPNGSASMRNGCMDSKGGFADIDKVHHYTFTFNGFSVSDFSLHMLDFGDYNPNQTTYHLVKMIAYDNSDNPIDEDKLEYHSSSAINPRSSTEFGDLYYTGDACDAEEGEPGNWNWYVSGSGIVRVELWVEEGIDPNIAFDQLCFTIEP